MDRANFKFCLHHLPSICPWAQDISCLMGKMGMMITTCGELKMALPQNPYPNPGTCLSLFEESLCRYCQVRALRPAGYPGLSRQTVNAITVILSWTWRWGGAQRHREGDMKMEAGALAMECQGQQQPEAGRGKGQRLPWRVQRECRPPSTSISAQQYWFWTSGLQNHEGINFCSFKPPSLF